MASVERTYVLCLDCHNISLSFYPTNTTYLVDGRQFDRARHAGNESHLVRVTHAHLAIVAHAAANGHDSILILEDDVVTTAAGRALLKSEAINALLSSSSHAIVRLNYRPYGAYMNIGGCPRACQYAARWGSQPWGANVGVGCELHSSAAYILSKSLYRQFIGATGVIDMAVMWSLPNVLIIPLAALQPHPKAIKYLHTVREFHRRCNMSLFSDLGAQARSWIPSLVNWYYHWIYS
jgi:hypothetical protein